LAEDLLSDVFLDVWRQAAKFEARSSVSTWLLAIARYKTLSPRRRRIDADGRDHRKRPQGRLAELTGQSPEQWRAPAR
jgi:DNA-directed RNA polymerase specialized sigma24 family protein